MTATQLLVVAKAHMIRLLHTQPELMDRFIAHLLARNTRLEANLTDQIFYSSEQPWLMCCWPLPAAMRDVCADAHFRTSHKRSSRKWSGPHAHV